MDGRSLSRFLDQPGSQNSLRDDLLYEYYWEPAFPQTPTMFALRGKRFKLIQYHGIWDTDELYDVAHDPQETRNLIDLVEHQELIASLRKKLHARLEHTGGLSIPLGFKRNHGSNQRHSGGSQRAEFPANMLQP